MRSDGAARWLFIWPTVIVILCLSLFPLIASVALSLSRLAFNKGGVDLKFIGFANYQQLLFGLERSHFLGVLKPPNPLGWLVVGATIVLVTVAWTRAVRGGRSARSGSSCACSPASCWSASSTSWCRRCSATAAGRAR